MLAQNPSTRATISPSTASAPIEHAERQYQSFPGSQYVLPSDTTESDRISFSEELTDTNASRLALQHRVLIRAFEDRLILPPVVISGEESILDSGTGSGIWVLDAMSRLPASVKLYGVDIESRLFPIENESVISRGNTHFSVDTITKLPMEWSDTFAIINQRLLVAALQSAEWEAAAREMYRCLVPGGWVQLGEVGPWKAGPVTHKHHSLVHTLFASKGLLLDCAEYIPALLRNAGFINVYTEERAIPVGEWAGEVGIDGRDNFIGVFRGMKTPILNAGGLGYVSTEGELDVLLNDVQKEWDVTEGAEFKFFIFYAQKP
ncbi:predicted protein [Postia placenta Mad-698-R]|nr:predicted protein [Postia placenta Mad-698-R]